MESDIEETRSRELVVLVHGFAAKRWLMCLFARRLASEGFMTYSWGYNSWTGSLGLHANRLRADLESLSHRASVIHLVAHSMGAIIARVAISKNSLPFLGRVVLLAPPNRGVFIASLASPFARRICPAITELSKSSNSFVNCLSTPSTVELGIIRARFDVLVSPSSTSLQCAADQICIAATHNSLLFQKNAASQVCSFLNTGKFWGQPTS